MKGTFSELELSILRARSMEALKQKARPARKPGRDEKMFAQSAEQEDRRGATIKCDNYHPDGR
jgi:hypothetical protein